MRIKLSGQHIEISDAVKQHVTEKLTKIANRFPSLISAEVIVIKEHGDFVVDIATHYEGRSIAAKGTDKVMYPAIAQAVKKLDNALRHRKGQLRHDLHQKPVLAVSEVDNTADVEAFDEYDEAV